MKRNGRLVRALLCAALIMLALAAGAAAADTATETWLAASGNQLWVGGEQVTAENADNITGSGIEGTVSFAVKDGVPTLTLNGATITGGKTVKRGETYVQPVYFMRAAGAGLTVALHGDNRVEAEAQGSAVKTVGFFEPLEEAGALTITGDASATLYVEATEAACYVYDGVTIRGGADYTFHSGSGYGGLNLGKGFYAYGPIVIENATVTAESENGCGIYADGGDALTIRNSTVTATGASNTGKAYAGIFAYNKIAVQNSTLTATGTGCGIYASGYYGIDFSGADTVVQANAGAGHAAIVSDYYNYGVNSYAYIFLKDGLSIAAPVGGRVLYVDELDAATEYYGGYTIVDSEGNVASAVTIHKHAPGASQIESAVAAGCETDGSYDEVQYCTLCRAELSRVHKTVPATGHVWGDWVVTTPATVNAAGVETKTCQNDPSHTMTRAIKKLTPTTGTVGVPSVRDVPAAGAEAAKTVFSACAGSRACPIHPFADASSAAWYHDGVHYCLDEGLMTGVGGGRFAPDGGMTRAMLVAVLYRLEGEPDADGGAAFTDVAADAWFADAVGWASSEGIVDGYGDGRFGPDDALTREQLAAILYRYARYRGLAAAADAELTRYADAAQIAGYAVSALRWACGSGLVDGMVQNGRAVLLPASAVTRAQTAAILQRLCTKLL